MTTCCMTGQSRTAYELSLHAGLGLPSKTAAACTEVSSDLAETRKVSLFLANKPCRCKGPATDALIQAVALESAEVVFEFGSG